MIAPFGQFATLGRWKMRNCGYFVMVSVLSLVWGCSGEPQGQNAGGNGPGGNGGNGGNGNNTGGESVSSSSGQGGSGTSGNSGSSSGSGGSSGNDVGAVCGAFQGGIDLLACAATYMTGASADTAGGVAVTSDGAVLYAGSIAEGDLGAPVTTLLGGGTAGIARLTADGRQVLGVTRLGNSVTDIAVRRSNDQVAVSGSFGAAVLDAQAKTLIWSSADPGAATEIAIGEQGTVAALAGKTVTVLDATGKTLTKFDVATNQAVHDIAVDDTTKLVFATGFKQDDGAPCTQLQIPFIRAYGFDGMLKWKAYDWNKAEVGSVSECADSRGYALSVGPDGKLYYAGESHGGNSVHRRQSQDITQFANNIKFDPYNDPYNLNGAAPIGYYARFDAATGANEQGQFICTRLSAGKGNAARPRSIAVTDNGNVLVGGASACCIENGATQMVNGTLAMPTYAGGGFLLAVSGDFTKRLAWTAFNGTTGSGANGIGVATGKATAAILMQQNIDPAKQTSTTQIPLLTFDAVQSTPGGGDSDGYLVVFPSP